MKKSFLDSTVSKIKSFFECQSTAFMVVVILISLLISFLARGYFSGMTGLVAAIYSYVVLQRAIKQSKKNQKETINKK